jgi:hypothetical protein
MESLGLEPPRLWGAGNTIGPALLGRGHRDSVAISPVEPVHHEKRWSGTGSAAYLSPLGLG